MLSRSTDQGRRPSLAWCQGRPPAPDIATGLVYHPVFLEHDTGAHPERAERLIAIRDALQGSGLWDHMELLEPQQADEAVLELVHERPYLDFLQRISAQGGGRLDPDTVMSPHTLEASLRASGGAVAAVQNVLEGRWANAIVLPRPPGHHATRNRAMGFCFHNHVAVAAGAALARRLVERVQVVDIDVHHGNGTQDIFYDRADLLYFSTHQYPFYPGTGAIGETGRGLGVGYTVNVPLPARTGDRTYGEVARRVLAPAGERYRPDIVIISLGFDAHWRDPLAQLQLSLAGYWGLVETGLDLAARLCQGRVVVCLEGGYDLEVLGMGMAGVARALVSAPPEPDSIGPAPFAEPQGTGRIVDEVVRIHGL